MFLFIKFKRTTVMLVVVIISVVLLYKSTKVLRGADSKISRRLSYRTQTNKIKHNLIARLI
jgi:hypothetical protein